MGNKINSDENSNGSIRIKILHLISSIDNSSSITIIYEKHVSELGGDILFLGSNEINDKILSNYDIIICSGGSGSLNNKNTGNILYNYIMNGGKCISIRASNQKASLSNSYCLKGQFPHAFLNGDGPSRKIYTRKDINIHPIMENIDSFTTRYCIETRELTQDSNIIAYWDDGCILGAEKNVGNGKIISLSFGYHCTKPEEIKIIKNSIDHLINIKWDKNTHRYFPNKFKKIVFILLLIFKINNKNHKLIISKDMIIYIIKILCIINKSRFNIHGYDGVVNIIKT